MSAADSQLFFDVQQKTDKQHILDNPDTYIGSVESVDASLWIMDTKTEGSTEGDRIVEKEIQYVPGLFKLFDEGIVNCRDHVVRMKTKIDASVEEALPVTHIDVSITEDGTITMLNDGNGIDVAQKDGVWVPELVFAHLRTSTNYNKEEKKIVGGKNGFGFKLVLIWSTFGRVETVDHIRGLKYVQEYRNNLDEISPPVVTKCKTKPYTKVTFHPDYTRLGIDGLSEDMVSLLKKRVFDIAAVTDKSIKVRYNDALVPIKTFQQYMDLYIGDKDAAPRVYEENGPRWEYAVALTPSAEFVQVSFVNGIHTSKGGKHVEYLLTQITRKLTEYIEKKKKVKVNPAAIKEQLMLFVRCDVENPAFDSQTKDYLNTPFNKFGSKCDVSDKFIEKVAKLGVMDAALQLTELKDNKAAKKTDGSKSKNIRGIPKLVDANWAGTEQSNQCIIIFCEGDSAKAGVISGLSSEDRNTIGVYPMRGKVLNVRGEATRKISENKEITEIKKILGLETGKQYHTLEDVHAHLRYGKVVFMTDQDLDGSHIKGLGINLFQSEWASLANIPGFIGFMNTPILKAHKGKECVQFYNDGEYRTWHEQTPSASTWTIKYYKGLGTSTPKEFKEYFKEKKFVGFIRTEKSDDMIDMVFNKKRADDRKEWLKQYDRTSYLDTSQPVVSYDDFIHKELIHFSKYDCDRSIPNLMDGLKISLRKILFSAFKKGGLRSELKVVSLSGYVVENSAYHHGEASLNAAIVALAQNFVGSNNINLFVPNGQFGTRLEGGKDSASERYIYTQLNPLTRLIFRREDDSVLKYLDDDGTPVEPVYYAPILPMILVNGSKGIGTGFSTDIMCYNPLDLIAYLLGRLDPSVAQEVVFVPYYEGFKGSIVALTPERFMIKGVYHKIAADKIRVTELPVGYWNADFKEHLEALLDPGVGKDGKKIPAVVKDYDDMSKDTNVDFTITFAKGKLEELEGTVVGDNGCNGVHRLLKLTTTNTTTNMHLFDAEEKLRKFDKVSDIIDCYYEVRLKLYETRKVRLMADMEEQLMEISNKARYITEVLEGKIVLNRKKKEEILGTLSSRGFNRRKESYDYLIKMPMDSVSEEKVAELYQEEKDLSGQFEAMKSTSVSHMWKAELLALREEYLAYRHERESASAEEAASLPKKKTLSAGGGGAVKKSKKSA